MKQIINSYLTKSNLVRAVICIAIVLLRTVAIAQETSSEKLFAEANQAFVAGDYCKAADMFKATYEIDKLKGNISDNDLGFECHNAAISLSACGTMDEAEQLYLLAIKHFTDSGNDSLQLSVYEKLTTQALYRSDISKADEYLQHLNTIAQNTKNEQYMAIGLQLQLRLALHSGDNDLIILTLEKVHANRLKKLELLTVYESLYSFHSAMNNSDSTKFYLIKRIEEIAPQSYIAKAELQLELAHMESSDSLYKESIINFEKGDDILGSTTAKNEYGVHLLNKNSWDSAMVLIKQAYDTFTEINYEQGIASTASNLGYLFKLKNDLQNSQSYYGIAEKCINFDPDQYIVMLNNSALVQVKLSNFTLAIDKYFKALDIASNIESKDLQSLTYNNLGGAYLQMGDFEKAMHYFTKALHSGIETFNDNYFATLGNMAEVLKQAGKTTEAISYFENSLQAFVNTGNEKARAVILNNLGNLYTQEGEFQNAKDRLDEAFTIAKANKFISIYSNVTENLGSLYFHQNDKEQAKYYFKLAIDIKRQTREFLSLSTSLNNIAVLYLDENENTKAIEFLEESVSIIENVYNNLTDENKRTFLANQINAYENLVLAYSRERNFEKALYYNELKKSKLLKERLNISITNDITSLAGLQEYCGAIDVNFFVITTMNTLELTCFIINKSGIEYYTIPKKNILSVLLSNIEVRSTLTSQLEQNDLSYLKKYTHGEQIPIAKQNLFFNKIISGYNSLLEGKDQNEIATYQTLFGKTLELSRIDKYTDSKTLCIVPDVEMAFFPFETLKVNNELLIEKYDITYINSISVHRHLNKQTINIEEKTLAIGVTEFNFFKNNKTELPLLSTQWKIDAEKIAKNNGDLTNLYLDLGYTKFSALAFVEKELTSVAEETINATILMNEQATEERIKYLNESGELEQFTTLHFSTHGISTPEVPELSSLVFPSTEGSNDGFLSLSEITDLNLNARLVNLSACESGLGKTVKGEGIIGLSYAFLSAGAKGVCMSLWTVDEESTSVFMSRFYELVANGNLTYTEALSQVKREFAAGKYGKTWKAPYFWAPFVFNGVNSI